MLKTYYQLAKPGIIYGNLITASAGFFLAARGNIRWLTLIAMLVGLSLVIGGSCVFNNYFDRDIDAKMARTKDRALVTGTIAMNSALIYASGMLALGAATLYRYTNGLTALVALVGAFFYIVLYTPLKRRTSWSTLIGAVAGATPPVVGLCAVTDSLRGALGLEAALLFLMLVFWQMPHFYAIAVRRKDEYAAAGIPILPLKRSVRTIKIRSILWIILFIVAASLLALCGFAGATYLAFVWALGIVWLYTACSGSFGRWSLWQKNLPDALWARRMFLFSLIVITALSIVLALNSLLH